MRYQEIMLSYCVALLGTVHAQAHHAAAAVFTTETIEIEGYVTEFNFNNPHVNIILNVIDDSGVETRWMATAPAAPPFRRWGWSADTIQEGQYVRLVGRKSRDGGPMILLEGEEILGGELLELDPTDGSVIRVLEGISQTRASTAVPVLSPRLADGRPNLGGTWLGGPPPRGGRTPSPLNERGRAVQAEFDPINDPAFAECAEPGLIRQVATIHPMRITQYDDRVVLEFESYAGRRVIYLDGRAPETDAHTRFGHHVARYEGAALVIETTQLLGMLTGGRGNMLSDQTTTVETYRRADDPDTGPALEMTMVVTDPGHLTGAWTITWRKTYTTDDYEFIETDCRVPFRAGL